MCSSALPSGFGMLKPNQTSGWHLQHQELLLNTQRLGYNIEGFSQVELCIFLVSSTSLRYHPIALVGYKYPSWSIRVNNLLTMDWWTLVLSPVHTHRCTKWVLKIYLDAYTGTILRSRWSELCQCDWVCIHYLTRPPFDEIKASSGSTVAVIRILLYIFRILKYLI